MYTHRLVLQYNRSPCEPSGLTNPHLHIFGPDGTDIATTDGTTFSLASGPEYPTAEPAAAVNAIRHGQHAASRACLDSPPRGCRAARRRSLPPMPPMPPIVEHPDSTTDDLTLALRGGRRRPRPKVTS